MTAYLFDTPEVKSIQIVGETARYPVHRIFCVGRNYEAHAAEMGVEADREAPFYFTKNPHAVVQSGAELPYPRGTSNYHYEMEFCVALGADGVYAYGCGLDMTRRDLQAAAKEKRRPWDVAKDGEQSAILSAFVKAEKFGSISTQRICLKKNGVLVQDASLGDMIHSVPEIIADLSKYYQLGAGDVIMTGTPAGVGPIDAGDGLRGFVDGLPDVNVQFTEDTGAKYY